MTELTKEERATRRATHSAWKALYRVNARDFLAGLAPRQRFTGEDLRDFIEARIGRPYNQNCWGGMATMVLPVWLDTGQIERAGFAGMKSKKANDRKTPVYRKPGSKIAAWFRKLFG